MKILGLLLALVMLLQGAPEKQPEPYAVATLNIHGSVDRNGNGNAGKPEAVTRDVVALAKQYQPRVIALQELCLRQHRSIKPALAKLGYAATMAYVDVSGGCNDKAKGNKAGIAVYLKTSKISWRKSAALPWGKNAAGTTGRQPRRVLCAQGKDWREIVCTTHLAPSDPDRAAQAAKARSVIAGWAKKTPIVLAGDLNMSEAAASAAFPGLGIAGHRIDWALTHDRVALIAAAPVPSSDHPVVVVSVTPGSP